MTEDKAVTNFREYLRVNTVQPDPDYDGAVAFLRKMAAELELPIHVVQVAPNRPIPIISWAGQDQSLPSLLLTSHMDVVPVFPEHWGHEPFSAHKDEKGDIYARGSQDMKCVSMQYIEAIRRLKQEGKAFKRTIHMSFTTDEEIGSELGMQILVNHDDFKKLNVGFILDEGLANPTDKFTVFYSERQILGLEIKCIGSPGHGSRFIGNTSGEKLKNVITSVLAYRDEQEKKLKDNPDLRLGDVTTANLTMIQGGIQYNVVPAEITGGVQFNVVPAEITVGFDVRLTPTTPLEEFEAMVKKWCADAGPDVTYHINERGPKSVVTSTDKSDPWWNAFSTACEKLDMNLELEIFPAGTDSRFLRFHGYPAIGFSPMNNTPILLHDHNEFLNENIFLRGIEIYYGIISSLANV